MRREYKRAWSWTVEGRGGAKGRGDARQGEEEETCLLVRKKEESGASTCIFHSFAILSIRGGIRSGEKSKKGRKKKKEGKKGSGREARWWTFVIDDDPPLLSAIRMAPVPATHDLEARPSPRPLL